MSKHYIYPTKTKKGKSPLDVLRKSLGTALDWTMEASVSDIQRPSSVWWWLLVCWVALLNVLVLLQSDHQE